MKKAVFVVGASRSGTTMLGRMLGKHSAIHTFKELHFFEQVCTSDNCYDTINDTEKTKILSRLVAIERDGFYQQDPSKHIGAAGNILQSQSSGADTYADIYRLFLDHETNRNGKQIACEQTPRYVYYIENILELYNDASVISIVRDPRAVLTSQKHKINRELFSKGKFPFWEKLRIRINYHPYTMSKLWRSAVKEAIARKNHNRVKIIRFEDLINHPEDMMKEIDGFLGLQYEPGQTDIEVAGSSLRKDEESRKGVDKNVIDKWKTSGVTDTELYICQKVGWREMSELGYEKLDVRPNIFHLLFLISIFPIHIMLALLANKHRMKNMFTTIMKRL